MYSITLLNYFNLSGKFKFLINMVLMKNVPITAIALLHAKKRYMY